VTSLIRADVYKWGMLMAGALVAAAPPLVLVGLPLAGAMQAHQGGGGHAFVSALMG
jgi:hypothetical protein